MENATESAIDGARDQIEETVSATHSIPTNVSKATENSEQSTTLKTPVNKNVTESIFESPEMGIKLKYPYDGHIEDHINDCQSKCYFFIYLDSISRMYDKYIIVISSESIKRWNLPDSLLDFAKHYYLELASPNFKYINDNQTTISHRTAIQLESESTLNILIQNGDFFYTIETNLDRLDNYTEYIKVKEIIDSIQFEGDYKSDKISEDIVPFNTDIIRSTERGYPSFINETDLADPEILLKINDTKNFRERYDEFVFDNSTIGIKLTYKPSDWYIYYFNDIENCYKERCGFHLHGLGYKFNSLSFLSIPPNEYAESCNCTNIHDYIKSIYDEAWGYKSDGDYELVNDNLTLIDNHTAIQMEFVGKKGSDKENEHYIYLITQVNDIFYRITYDIKDDLPKIKKIIDSIQFIEMDKPKRPSFM